MIPLLVPAALVGLLRFGPLPTVEVAPGGEVSIPLEEYIVADSPVARVDVAAPSGLQARTLAGLWVVAGPAPERGIHPVTIDLRTLGGERAEATLLVAVAERPERDVVLRYRPSVGERPARVVAAGEWNAWREDATPLSPSADGAWEARVRLAPGRYAYKFVVDGRWTPDPSNPLRAPDGFGGENTILVVEGGPPPPRLLPRHLGADRAVLEFVGDLEAVAALVDEAPAAVEVAGNRIAVVLPPTARVVRVVATDRARRVARFRFETPERTWRDAVLYYAVVDRFANGDTSNDRPVHQEGLAPQANWTGGDLAGLRAKIDEGYFDRLGVDAIWISPHLANPDRAYRDALPPHRLFTGYHGYWPVDSFRVEERFGTIDDLRALVEAAHAHGIRILLDMVYTHVHEEHPLRRARPDLFVPLDLPDGRRNIRLFDEFPMTTWFDEFLPKIDYEKDEAVEWAMEVTRFWLERTGVDGFRLDAVKHIPHRFWRALRREVAAYEARTGRMFWTVGETIDSRRTISSFVRPSMLDGQFDFPLYWTIRETLGRGTEGLDRLEAEIARSEREYPEGSIMSPLVGNHDVARFVTYADGDLPPGADEKAAAWGLPVAVDSPAAYDRLKTAFTLLLSLDGVPMIYYGDEIGLAGAHDPDNRRVMRFGEAVTDAERGVGEHLARAAAARRLHPALRRGARRPLLADAERLAFLKTYFDDAALVAVRRGGDDAVFDLEVAPDLADGTVLRDALGSGVRATVENGRVRFALPPLSSAVLVP